MAKKIRLIARLDVKDEHLVKGIQYEGLRKLGAPHDFAVRYYEAGIDELLYLDTVASLYGRNNLSGILQRTSADVFIPVTAGGGVRSVQDVRALLRAGADKVAVNTAALKQPALITAIAQAFGRQCMVLSVQAKRRPGGGWEAYFDNGREHSGRDAVAWAAEGAQRGAGEILLTSVDAEGCRRGMDTELVAAVCAPPSLLSSNSICMPRQMPKSGVPARAFSTSGAARPLSHSAAMPSAKAPTPGSTSAPARRTCSGVWASCGCAPRAASARHTLSRLLRP